MEKFIKLVIGVIFLSLVVFFGGLIYGCALTYNTVQNNGGVKQSAIAIGQGITDVVEQIQEPKESTVK